jgi:hypothetical protein
LKRAVTFLRTGLVITCGIGVAVSLAVLADTGWNRSFACRGVQQYLDNRWNETLGIDGGDAPPGQTSRAVDRLVGGLPLPPKSMKVMRGEELRNLVRGADATPSAVGQATTECPAADDATPYRRRLHALLRDLRIFAGCNLTLFLLAALLVARGRARAVDCLVPATLLAAATLASSLIYVAAQDWFWSFVDGGYAGFGYLLVVVIVTGLFADIIWNGARVVRFLLRLSWWVPV